MLFAFFFCHETHPQLVGAFPWKIPFSRPILRRKKPVCVWLFETIDVAFFTVNFRIFFCFILVFFFSVLFSTNKTLCGNFRPILLDALTMVPMELLNRNICLMRKFREHWLFSFSSFHIWWDGVKIVVWVWKCIMYVMASLWDSLSRL